MFAFISRIDKSQKSLYGDQITLSTVDKTKHIFFFGLTPYFGGNSI